MPSKTKRRDAGAGALYEAHRHGCKPPCRLPADQCPKRATLWTARVELPAGPDNQRRQKVIRARDKAVAQEKLKKLMAELGRAGDLPTASPTVAQWMREWLNDPGRKTKTRTTDGYAGNIERYIIPAIGKVRLDKLATHHVKHLHRTITDAGLSSTTALGAHRVLAKALTDAMREGKVTRNVATLVPAPSKALSDRGALTAEQARALLQSAVKAASDDPAGDLDVASWTTALVGGLRQAERLGLTVEFVELDRVAPGPDGTSVPAPTLTVAWQLQRLLWKHGCADKSKPSTRRCGCGDKPKSGVWPCGKQRAGYCTSRHVDIPEGHEARRVHGGLWLTRPKSRAGWRQVPMPAILAEVLRRYMAAHKPGDEGLIFTRSDGHPIDPRDDTAAWTAALAAAGMPHVVGHSARHTANTLLHQLGVDSDTREKIMGHSSAVSNQTYIHIADPLMRDAMNQLGDLLAPRPAELES